MSKIYFMLLFVGLALTPMPARTDTPKCMVEANALTTYGMRLSGTHEAAGDLYRKLRDCLNDALGEEEKINVVVAGNTDCDEDPDLCAFEKWLEEKGSGTMFSTFDRALLEAFRKRSVGVYTITLNANGGQVFKQTNPVQMFEMIPMDMVAPTTPTAPTTPLQEYKPVTPLILMQPGLTSPSTGSN